MWSRCSIVISQQDHVNRHGIESIMKLQVSTKCKHLNNFASPKHGKTSTEGTHLSEPQKAHPTGLLLWCKMVAASCFIWPPALQLWSGRQAGRQADENSSFSDF